MTDTKKWWQSKGTWGAVIAVLAGLGTAFGVEITAADQALASEHIVGAITAVGGIIALAGRIWATKRIG
jgi:hypothetical protein